MTDPNGLTRREFLRVAGLSGFALAGVHALAACSSPEQPPGEGDASPESPDSPAQQAVELTVSNWPALMYAVPWAVALEDNLYGEHGIDLDGYVGSAGGGTTVRNVVTGGIPLGSVATPASINAFEAGAPLKIIGGSIGTTADVNFVTLPDRGIQGIEDLVGRTVGFTNPGSATHAAIVLALKAAGLEPDDVNLQAMGGLSETHTGLREGVIDAAPHAYPTFLLQEDEDWQVVFDTADYIHFMQLCLIAGSPVIDDNEDMINSLVEIYREACQRTVEDPGHAAEAWAANSDVPEEVGLQSLELIDREDYYTPALSAEGINSAYEAMVETDLLDEGTEIEWDEVIDQRFLTDDEQVDLSELV